MKVNLTGKVAVVTGGGGILCGAFAKKLAECGAQVAVLDLNVEAAQKVADEIVSNGGSAKAFKCNVLEMDSIVETEKAVYDAFGQYHILINGAGGNSPHATTTNELYAQEDVENEEVVSFFDLKPEGFEFVFSLNLMGTILPSQVFIKRMIGVEGASVINMSSMSAPCPMTKVPAYSAAKAAIDNITQWLSVHFAHTGIRVNAIAPGFFLTQQNKKLLTNEDGSLTERSGKIIGHTPMRRFGVVDDLFGALLWLCDEEASGFVTGITMPIDGGFMAYSGV